MEEKKKAGRPSVPDYKKQVVVSFRLLKTIADVYPAERIKRTIVDLYSGDVDLGMDKVSKSVKSDVSVSDRMARAREALSSAEKKIGLDDLSESQKASVEAFGAVVVNPYAHNKEAHQLCDRLFALVVGSGNNVELIKMVNGFLGGLEDARDSGF